MSNSSIWHIDRTLSGATTLDLGATDMKTYFVFTEDSELLEYAGHSLEEGLTPLHSCRFIAMARGSTLVLSGNIW